MVPGDMELLRPGYTDCPRGCGGIGRRARLRSVCPKGRGGSSPLIRISGPLRSLPWRRGPRRSPRASRGGACRGRKPSAQLLSTHGSRRFAEGTTACDLRPCSTLAEARRICRVTCGQPARRRERHQGTHSERNDSLALPHRLQRNGRRCSTFRRWSLELDRRRHARLREHDLSRAHRSRPPHHGCPGTNTRTAGPDRDRCRQALGNKPSNRREWNEDRRHRRRHRFDPHLLRRGHLQLSRRVPQRANVTCHPKGDCPTGVCAGRHRLRESDHPLRLRRIVPRNPRCGHRCRRPQHPDGVRARLWCCPKRLSRQLQGAVCPDTRVRA